MDSIIQPKGKNIITLSFVFLSLFVFHYGSVIFLGEINSFNKITYAIYAILISLVFFYEKYRSKSKINKSIFQAGLWLIPIYILYSFLINKNSLNLGWFIGDFIVIWSIILSILLGSSKKIEILNKDFLDKLMLILFIILLLDFLMIFTIGTEGKIRSFSRLIIVPSFYIYRYFETKKINNLYIILICFALAVISNMRYAFIVMFLMLMMYSVFYYKERIISFLSFRNISFGFFILFFTTFILYQNNILQKWSFYYLFVPAFQGELGIVNVFIGRIYEVQDAYNEHIRHFNIGSIFFGNGLGASYTPNEWVNFFIKDFSSQGAVSDNIKRHILHFGPMRFYFRYGIIGLGLIFYIIYKNLNHLAISLKNQSFNIGLFFSVTLFLYLLRFPLQPIFNDPMLLFCLMGFFTYYKKVDND